MISDPILDELGDMETTDCPDIASVLFEVILSGNALIDVIDACQTQRMRRKSDMPKIRFARERWCAAKESLTDALQRELGEYVEVSDE